LKNKTPNEQLPYVRSGDYDIMQIDWVNVLATVTVASVAVSAVLGAGSALAYKIIQVREARRQK
jgi:hypothetical protein